MRDKSALLIAAPSSGSGKTVFTLGLLRALKQKGVDITSAKAGPDYIDPGFHAVASGTTSVNLDPWAMNHDRLSMLAVRQSGTHLLIEGMMGLYDGAADGTGSAAELAKTLGCPVLLIVDAAKQSHSVAALVRGFRDHDPSVNLAGVILNKVGSERHGKILTNALDAIGVPVLGIVHRDERLELQERHLGLVIAEEVEEIESQISQVAELIASSCDLDRIHACFQPLADHEERDNFVPPLGQNIAVARDEAFTFIYPHLLEDWRDQGAAISFFSPLNDEVPETGVDAIFLPGGYPELHAGKLAQAEDFKTAMIIARNRETLIYGECGGYMVLGEGLIDAEGKHHEMTGLLHLVTSFEKRKLHLGYRKVETERFPLGNRLTAHEFHYSSVIEENGESFLKASDALGNDLGQAGLREEHVMGSYMHIIDGIV